MKRPNPRPRFIKHRDQSETYHTARSQEPPVTKVFGWSKAKAPSIMHKTYHLTVGLGTFLRAVQPVSGG